MIQPAGGVVVARGVAGGDVEGHVQTAGDLVEDLFLKLAVDRRRLFGVDLAELPSARQHRGHAAFEFHQVHRLDRIGLAVGRGVGVEHGREVGRRLRRGQHRQRVAPQLGEQRQGRRDLGNAAALARPVGAEVVDHRRGRHAVVVQREPQRCCRPDGSSGRGTRPGCRRRRRRCRRRRWSRWSAATRSGVATWSASISRRSSFTGESTFGLATSIANDLARLGPGHPHGAELFGQADGIGPAHELLFDTGWPRRRR